MPVASSVGRIKLREKIHTLLEAASIRYVTLDRAGYRLGSLNEALSSR
jgi:PP-loop superfamily ATP-utilizing enzyme